MSVSRLPDRAARLGLVVLAVAATLAVSGCQSDVVPAVFGLGAGGVAAYSPGTLPVVAASDGDRLIGQSANETGRCIYSNDAGRRFRADCPPGYRP